MGGEIDHYITALPAAQREVLTQLRRLLLTVVPQAEEAIRTRVPAVRYKGKTVVGYGAATSHVALYVMFGDALRTLKSDFARFDVTNRVVRFSPDAPIPATLVRKVVRSRLAEIDAQEERLRPVKRAPRGRARADAT